MSRRRRRRRSGNRGHRLQTTRVGPNGRTHRPEPYRQVDSDPENVVCPRCDAGPGDRCETRTGDERDPHAARVRAASGNPPPPDRHPRREHAITANGCPLCGAAAGDPCLRQDGHPRRRVHLARLERAEHFHAHTTAAGATAPRGGGQARGSSTPG